MDDNDLWLQTYTGLAFFPLAPHEDQVSIEDIAHALSLQCRFAGHTRDFYSVAQHSVLVSRYVPPKDALWGLLHDAAEAYLVDLPRPLKHHSLLGFEYRQIEERVERVICQHFRLPPEKPSSIGWVERRLLRTEQRDLLLPMRYGQPAWRPAGSEETPYSEPIVPLVSWQAELEFTLRFGELMGLREAQSLRPTIAAPRNEASAAAGRDGDGVTSPPLAGGRAFPTEPPEDAA